METRAHYVIIGAFTIGVFLLALGFVMWMSKSGTDLRFNQYEIEFTEAVTGLSVGGLVQYNGIKVGEVSALRLAPDDPRKVIARVSIDANAPVRTDTRAKLGIQGVTGLAFIQLSGGAPGNPPLLPTKDNPIPRIPSEESALSKLLASGSDVVTSVNDLLLRMNQVLSEENVRHVSATLSNIDQLSASVAEERGNITLVLKQLSEATGELKRTLAAVNTTADTTNALLRDDARAVLQSTQRALASADKVAASAAILLDDNRGAIDRFTNQGLRQIGPTVAELRETLRSLKQLSDKLSASDSLLLGRDQPKEYKPQ
ncbi:MlaD family protein [Dokdonella sp.]|uniref:MlaD family protein n=1 Tax=Dokdonella sp. TaxID=2291710 RepID=UPI001B113089|nr:MlaD family protein [Dokdonella sp.]MBO9664727.1 MCE family protein [Dokdonella sp.]